MNKIGIGGSCHWCTEAIFQSLTGVMKVDQGWISSKRFTEFSEAIVVKFNPNLVSLETLIKIHLHTHSCTSNHPLRDKYRSAVYCFDLEQKERVQLLLHEQQKDFDDPIITRTLHFQEFKKNKEEYLDYYYSDPSKSFCQNIINPKLHLLLNKYRTHVDVNKLDL